MYFVSSLFISVSSLLELCQLCKHSKYDIFKPKINEVFMFINKLWRVARDGPI